MASSRGICVLLAAALLAAHAADAGEIYRWTDGEGRVHFTEDLSQVPPAQRVPARRRAGEDPGTSRFQTYRSPAETDPAAAPARPSAEPSGRVHRIRVERAGSGMIVPVRINGRTTAPFLIDTGASYVLVPQRVAEEAGVQLDGETRTMRFATANGVVEHPLVMLDSVDLGGARADDVPAAVTPMLEVGLLGLSFFNRFTYQVDAAAGMVTLRENGLESEGGIRGGRSEGQWRSEFRSLAAQIDQLEAERARTPSSHGRQLRELETRRATLARQLDLLQGDADRARVPDAWRR
jgi:clan AA aspartic protease (TIGR02281 family)